ncbi:acylneuraminate cytidylyltransferase [Streptomyces sp. NPDC002994]|uniref:acylneuraminate cytidylyltransferase n=1 Tax=Streptomyces sp. NPDC002994 TaxID=3154441 RepID=UPI0033AED103
MSSRPQTETDTEPVRRVLAVIPARGGSKGVPAKNLAPVGGVPLVARAVRACLGAGRVTDVVVSTDDPAIAAAARGAGAEVALRPADIAGDTATSEAAVLHALDTHEALHGAVVDVVLLVQCTSPFLTSEDVDGVCAAVVEDGADTAHTVAPFHGFVWREAEESPTEADTAAHAAGALPMAAVAVAPGPREADGPAATAADAASPAAEALSGPGGPCTMADHPTPAGADGGQVAAAHCAAGADGGPDGLADHHRPAASGGQGVNHDKSFRPRRQDRPQDFLETGAAYAMDAAGFRKAGHRFFGRTALVVTDPARVLEIDDPHDLARARALAPLLDPRGTDLPTRDDIDAVVIDFDGTQTDDRVLIDSEGRELVAVHRGDGLGIAALRNAGLKLLILSTEQNAVVAARARKLRIPVLHGIDRKDLALKQWCEEQGVAPERVLYAGNDVNDLSCLALVGWPVAVANAHDTVRAAARAVTTVPGGDGAIREMAAWILGPSLTGPSLTPTP